MSIGIGTPIYDLANLPGQGGGGSGPALPTVDLINNTYSMKFSNADDTYFDTGLDIAASTDWTISFWIATGGTATATTPLQTYPVNIGGGVGNSDFLRFGTGWNNSGRAPSLQADNADGQNYDVYCPASIPSGNTSSWFNDGQWRHLVISRDNSTQNITLYIDSIFTQWRDYGNSYPDTDGLRLNPSGRLYLGHPTNPANAIIDEVAYFERILSQDEITAIYDATTSGMTADLSTLSTGAPTAWYRMGD